MTTWQDFDESTATGVSGASVTTWIYHNQRGFLTRKQYDDGNGTDYTYTPAGRLATRTWDRGRHTRYDYNTAGDLSHTRYFLSAADDTGANVGNDPVTPDVSLEYDRLGRKESESNGLATTIFIYDPATLAIDTETVEYDFDLDGTADFTRVLDREQDSLLRDSGWKLGTVAQYNNEWIDENDNPDRENATAYTYDTATGRLDEVSDDTSTFAYGYTPNSNLIASVTGPAHTVTNTYESTRNVLDAKSNRKLDTTEISAYDYTVNAIGQRTNVSQTGSAFGSVRDITWSYDSLGQVTSADSTIPGLDRSYQYDLIGNRLKTADSLTLPTSNNYTPNAVNQYTAIDGLTPSYDDDGNMTSGPLPANVSANSTLIWDGENRLIEAQVNGGNTVTYGYDSQSRRIIETVGSETTVYVYDGWNPIAEYSTSLTLTKTYTWGMDLSGSMQGAGGVGGLLSVTDGTGTYFPTYDGNGNVSEYLDDSGNVVAHYEYDPFGKTTVATGSKAQDFAHRFSTKPLDATTGLYYYGYRWYDAPNGRWPSRDPIEEEGGINLYGFVGNDGIGRFDVLGEKWKKKGKTDDERRLVWIREDEENDTMEDLAKKVGLDPDESDVWAIQDEDKKCQYTTPNIYIMIKLLNGVSSFRDIYTNPGDEIGDFFTYTGSAKKVEVSNLNEVVSTISEYAGDIIGLSLYAHGSTGYIYSTSGDRITQNSVLSAVDENGFKLKKASIMQCYSGAGGYDNAWNQRVVGGNATTYQGLNVCGLDLGKKAPKKRKLGPPHRR